MSPDRLVYMINQIANYFKYQRDQDPAEGIANHIRRSWDPRMRKEIFAYFEKGGEGLEGPAWKAIEILYEEAKAKGQLGSQAAGEASLASS